MDYRYAEMTNRELLEKAAKAADIEGEHRTEHLCVYGDWMDVTAIFLDDDMGWWNPLTSDSNALRLAVDLDLLFDLETSRLHSEELAAGSDKYEAVRRAFTRAAAAMAA